MDDAVDRKAEIEREEEMKEPEAMAEMSRLTPDEAVSDDDEPVAMSDDDEPWGVSESDDDEPVAVSDMSIYDIPYDEEKYGTTEEDKEFARTVQRESREMKNEHLSIFKRLTGDGKYKYQHWHMTETPVTKELINRKKIPEDEYLLLLFDPELFKIYYYGDTSNAMPNTLQIYSIRIEADDDDYPLHVYGQVRLVTTTVRPQVIFRRSRENCQTLTKEDPYLKLTGPFCHPRPPPLVSLCLAPDLKLKGTTLSEDDDKLLKLFTTCNTKNLAARIDEYDYGIEADVPEDPYLPHVSHCCKEGKPCKCVLGSNKQYLLEMTRSIVTYSLWATISVQLVDSEPRNGKLPGCYLFTAYMESMRDAIGTKLVLLDSRDGKDPVKFRKNKLNLLRSTICVEHFGILIVCIEHGGFKKELRFKPQESGDKVRSVVISPHKIQVKVKWTQYWPYFNRLVVGGVI